MTHKFVFGNAIFRFQQIYMEISRYALLSVCFFHSLEWAKWAKWDLGTDFNTFVLGILYFNFHFLVGVLGRNLDTDSHRN